MKLFAYVHNAYDFFFPTITSPLVKELGHEFVYLDMWDYLTEQYKQHQSIDPIIMDLYWDKLFKSEKFDAIIGYNCPDEVTRRKCKEATMPYLVVEGFGRGLPEGGSLWPMYGDFETHYKNRLKETPILEKNVETLQITLALSWEPLLMYTIPYIVSNMEKQTTDTLKISSCPYWHASAYTCTNYNFCKTVVDACHQANFAKPWRLNIRPHPNKSYHFAPAYNMLLNYIKALNDPRIQIDNKGDKDWLDKTHVLICLNSGAGCEALKLGCEVITFESRTWYAHPQITHSPRTPNELAQTFKVLEEKIHSLGKRKAPLMVAIEEDLNDKLTCKAEHSIHEGSLEQQRKNLEKFFEVAEYAKSFPLLQ